MLGSAAILTIILVTRVAGGARILGVSPVTSVSHQIVYRAVTTELAKRGHELVVITTDPVNDPTLANYTEIDISFLYDFYRKNYNFRDLKIYSVVVLRYCTMMFSALFQFAT
ncbi:hypothetical protein PR048_019599 [Dryococelus australis]|uniref:Uncharacterized protein n=1 Tax=Dryococelus australis TaxID=614101 RepID=A0ABQ9H492_9NEOP|nr:hypothetical protein PR048_019599 [Dryococelus australis]